MSAERSGDAAASVGASTSGSGWEATGARRQPGLPSSVRVSPQLNALCQRAATGAMEDIQRLAKWSALVEYEAQMLRRLLRKQQHDFATLFEIVGQTSARSLNVVAMQTYLLRTVSGHFAIPKLLIVRRMRAEDRELNRSAAQGIPEGELKIGIDSTLCQFALERRFCFHVKTLPDAILNSAEGQRLKGLGIELVVPLVQDVEAPTAVLEGFLMLGGRLSGREYSEEDVEFLHILGKMLAICLRNEALYRRSIIDDLTGVASRGHFEAQLSQELNRIQTYGHKSLGLLMLDVDHFKEFNDKYGHQCGDKVLQELARVLVHQVRNVDLVARYGGEEFAVILLEIDRQKVMEVADRLRAAIEAIELQSPTGERMRITASVGLACFPDDATDKSVLIQVADEALYKSKDLGRNRVTVATPGVGLNRAASVVPTASAQPISLPAPGATNAAAPAVDTRPGAYSSSPGGRYGTLGATTPEIQRIQQQQIELAASLTDVPQVIQERRKRANLDRAGQS